jgi:hypothetical protein
VTNDVPYRAAANRTGAFDPIGPGELKGLTEAVSLHVARLAS